MEPIRIVFLGTSAAAPSRTRNVSSVAVQIDGRVLLFDCGEGTQHQLLRAPVRSGALASIHLSHLHGDHVYGLPGLLATLSLNGRTEPLSIFGPEGTREYLEGVLRTTHHHPSFEIRFQSTLDFAPLEHSVPCFGYRIVERDHPGKFDPVKAEALGFRPGPDFARLAREQDPRVVGPPRPGRRIVYCTDTRPCAAAIELARGADVLIHEATYGEELADEAHARFHSTAAGAARVAAEAGVGQLILTHFSTRYADVTPLLAEAQAIFPNTVAAEDIATFMC